MSDALQDEIGMYAAAVGARGAVMWMERQRGMSEEWIMVNEMESIVGSTMTREQIASLAATALWCFAQVEGELKERATESAGT